MKAVSLKAMALALFLLAANAAAQDTLYFLPPNEPEWIKRTPYLAYPGGNEVKAMSIAPGRCGWFKVAVSAADRSKKAVIYQGNTSERDMIGLLGLHEDPSEWVGGWPVTFTWDERVNSVGSRIIYFDAAGGENGWTSNYPGPGALTRCSYSMAAIIYDTYEGAFSAFNYGSNGNGTGIRRGIVKPKLAKDATTGLMKMEYNTDFSNPTDEDHNAWNRNPNDIHNAFRCTPGKNAMVCYDMPFGRDSSGLWTFDSDHLCVDGSVDLTRPYATPIGTATPNANQKCGGDGGGLRVGFFPNRLNAAGQRGVDEDPPLDARCTYRGAEGCWDCFDQYEAHGFFPLSTSTDAYCFERGLRGTRPACDSPYGNGQFGNFDNPRVWGCDWGGNCQARTGGDKNQYFCFETHATFIYQKGQEFFFRGDDDIWVFINNELVIDLGGNHVAAPGYVKLDSIGHQGSRWYNNRAVSGSSAGGSSVIYTQLQEGKEYPIDIFFCDRRKTMSNVRISTNMYITQENGLVVREGDAENRPAEICLKQEGGGTCAALLSGSSGTQYKCGGAVGEHLEYYVVNRRGDQNYPLTIDESYCGIVTKAQEPSLWANEVLRCFGGIDIDLNNGQVRINKNNVEGLSGTQNVYAKITEASASALGLKPPPDPILVKTFIVQTEVQMVWGPIRKEGPSGDVIENKCRKDNDAIIGKLVPICISGGAWGDNAKTFFIAEPEGSVGNTFRLNSAGLSDNASHIRSELEVYWDELGTRRVEGNVLNGDATFIIPASGVLVLWVAGGNSQVAMSYDFKINVRNRSSSEEVTVKSRLPHIKWVDQEGGDLPYCDASFCGRGMNKGSARDELGKIMPVYLGTDINLNLVAYDITNNSVCDFCNFPLRLKEAKAFSQDLSHPSATGLDLIDFEGELESRVVNGKSDVVIRGVIEVTGNSYADFTLSGKNDSQFVFWDSLQFVEPPIPYPDTAYLYDRDGDGIGDSLRIVYSRGFDKDTLPNKIEVFWEDLENPVLFGIADKKSIGTSRYEYEAPDRAANLAYWTSHLRLGGTLSWAERSGDDPTKIDYRKNVKDTIVLYRDDDGENIRFSEKIKTRGSGQIKNWATFEEETGAGAKLEVSRSFSTRIRDKMPAIVISAKFLAGDSKGCGSAGNNPCDDRVTLEFSEPVIGVEGATDNEIRNAFAYMLRDIGEKNFEILRPDYIPSARWPKGNMRPHHDGDSVVILTFRRWRSTSDNSRTPMPGDSVKFAVLATPVLMDLEGLVKPENGNFANPKEIGRQIEGRKPFIPEKIAIGEVDPNADVASDAKNVITEIGGIPPPDMFNKNRPIEILPVPPDWSAKDVAENYKGTIGMLFNPDISNILDDLEDQYNLSRGSLDEHVFLYARVFYHTNLGDYVVNRNMYLRCDDPIFPKGDGTNHSCRNSRNKIYIAWDMKDAKGRWVGAGAYVGVYDFRWEIKHPVVNESKLDNIDRKIEMHGVKRIKKK